MNGKNLNEKNQKSFDIDAIRSKLKDRQGNRPWRSFEEISEDPEFVEFLKEEFPRHAASVNSLNRRDFLKFLAAPLALAGLTACLPQPLEKIVPYVNAPPEITPGEPLFFATAMQLDGYARGLVVESHMGRPTKIEGNPQHPASLGATDAFAQGEILTLYDPERVQVVSSRGDIRTWDAFLAVINQAMSIQSGKQGTGLRILTGTVTSPTLANQLQSLLEQFPQAKWHQYDPITRDNIRKGTQLAFGEIVNTYYRFENAKVILSLDNQFVFREPGGLRYARDFASRRRVFPDQQGQLVTNRLYLVESSLSGLAGSADHRLPLNATQIEPFTQALANRLGVDIDPPDEMPPMPSDWLDALVADLQANRGASLILAGEQQPAVVHALAHAMNQALGNVGETVIYTEPVEANPVNQIESLWELVEDLAAGEVDLLVVLESNPVFNAPADLNFAGVYQQAGLSVFLGLYENETASLSDWHIPATHFLESWGDTRAYDGTITIQQPLIEPLYSGRSSHEILSVLAGQPEITNHEIVKGYWQSQSEAGAFGEGNFEDDWQRTLRDGVIEGSTLPEIEISLRSDFVGQVQDAFSRDIREANGGLFELVFEPDASIWDGRYANNGWLQELPRPTTKLTWDNVAILNPQAASEIGVSNGDVVELTLSDRQLAAPVWIQPGQPEHTVSIQLGYGRTNGGHVGDGVGVNAYLLRTSENLWIGQGLRISKLDAFVKLASTQHHQTMEGRHLVLEGTFDQFQEDPEEIVHEEEHLSSLYPEFEYTGHAWGMSINLTACIGCNACVIACQAENNIPVVGKEEVLNGREMHWLRIDRYFQGELENPTVLFQPVPCMHCEKAPCEPVCPVEATVHDEEGLNEMIYNRCVGTRYCSNNCPYKVRRFNFFQYSDETTVPLTMLRNPEVTVRSRGVMEKCTYCIQRIKKATIQAEVEGRPLRNGEIQTACQQACPTNAIIFGDINDEDSQVAQLKEHPLDYGLLAELGTQPRTTYLAKLKNPNPQIHDEETE